MLFNAQSDSRITFIDFWSVCYGEFIIDSNAGDQLLSSITVSNLPSNSEIIRVVGMIKYSKRVDSSGAENYIESDQVISIDSSSDYSSVVDMVDILADSFNTAANATEGGCTVFGVNDVKDEVTGNGTYYVTWELADAHGSSLKLYDVQNGVRIYFK